MAGGWRDRVAGGQTERRGTEHGAAPAAHRKRNLHFIGAGGAVPAVPGLHSALLQSVSMRQRGGAVLPPVGATGGMGHGHERPPACPNPDGASSQAHTEHPKAGVRVSTRNWAWHPLWGTGARYQAQPLPTVARVAGWETPSKQCQMPGGTSGQHNSPGKESWPSQGHLGALAAPASA